MFVIHGTFQPIGLSLTSTNRTSDDLFVHEELVCSPPLGPALIRPVGRMAGPVRPSLEPIRCTEREAASPSSVVLYVRMEVRA